MPHDLRHWIDEGRRHFISKHYLRAEQNFQKALRVGARYADVLNMLGMIYHHEGKFNDAIRCFKEAIEINPTYLEANLNLAALFNDLGDYREAKAIYRRVRGNHKESNAINPILKGKIANQHAALADLYAGIGCLNEAIDEYQKALKLCPTYKDIRTKLAVCYRDNKQTDLAVKELLEIVRKNPNYFQARIQLGLAYYAGKEPKKAVKEWQEVLKRDKNNTTAQMYLRIAEARP